jgi:hypothetical protein
MVQVKPECQAVPVIRSRLEHKSGAQLTLALVARSPFSGAPTTYAREGVTTCTHQPESR